jgi:PAS domain S-box-containing protein
MIVERNNKIGEFSTINYIAMVIIVLVGGGMALFFLSSAARVRFELWFWGITLVSIIAISSLLYLIFINQKKRIEKQHNLILSIFEKAPIGFYTVNKDGFIDSFNQKMLEINGAKSAKEVIGLNVFTLPSYQKSGIDALIREGLNSGKSFEVETPFISYVGGKESVRHYVAVPLLSEDGKGVERMLLMVEDVTEKRRLEEKLRGSKK